MHRQLEQAKLNPDLIYEKLWLAAKVIESTMEGLLVTDTDGNTIQIINPAFSELSGYAAEEAIGSEPTMLAASFQPTLDGELWQQARKQGSWQGKLWLQSKEGPAFLAWTSISLIPPEHSSDDPRYVIMFTDITDSQRTEQRLQMISTHDSLTSLPNRNHLLDDLGNKIEKASRGSLISLLYLDLDRFKIINDTLGHLVGDQLLYEVAQRLNSLAGENALVARLGGDEFALILSGTKNPEEVSAVAESILAMLQNPFHIEKRELHVTPSIGISYYPDDGTDAASLLQHAEIALYRAKQDGRNTYRYYSASQNSAALERLVMENSLRHALKRQEFRVLYEPQVELASGRILGAEALVRWHHPELGIIAPNDFIPLAEETGLMGSIDNWVLEECCQQLAAWQKSGEPLPRLSINLSTQQLQQESFLDRLGLLLKTYQVSPNNLTLEMTEGILIDNPEAMTELLRSVRQLGIRLALDDFGTGYSSLSHLKRLPLTSLKVDQSFVRDCLSSDDDSAIITAIASMAKSLKLEVVAEGVESREQLDFLLSLGCNYAQGYYFTKPVPATKLIKMLKQQPFLSSHPS